MLDFDIQSTTYLAENLRTGNFTRFRLVNDMVRLIKINISQFKNSTDEYPYSIYRGIAESYLFKSIINFFKVLLIINMTRMITATLFKQSIMWGLACVILSRCCERIEWMETTLVWRDGNYSWFLQEIAMNICSLYYIVLIEVYFDIFTETAWIFIADGFAVSEGFQQGITGKDFLLNWVVFLGTERSKKLHTILGRLGLSSATFSRNHDSLLVIGLSQRQKSLACN